MKKRIIRCVSELKFLEDGNLTYEQKITLKWFLIYGIGVLFFKKRKRDVINSNEIINIKVKESFWGGNTITIETDKKTYVLEATSKEHLRSIGEFLSQSQLKNKLERINN